ncbi:DUF1428 domain-containing protein [Rhodobacterales bacterium]|nr:DUF1428 domain-containing protein [Rhodobacterales bacterium]
MSIAERAADIYFEYGAIDLGEAWAANVPDGEVTSFPMAVKCESDEAVVFSWITWPDLETAEASVDRMMNDERWHEIVPDASGVFNMKRMILGGFEPVVVKSAPSA